MASFNLPPIGIRSGGVVEVIAECENSVFLDQDSNILKLIEYCRILKTSGKPEKFGQQTIPKTLARSLIRV